MTRQGSGLHHAEVPPERWDRLWRDVMSAEAPHAVAPAELAEFAALARRHDLSAAVRAYPTVARHLGLEEAATMGNPSFTLADPAVWAPHVEARCAACAADLRDLLAFTEDDEPLPLALPPTLVGASDAAASRLHPVVRRAKVGYVVALASAGVVALGAAALLVTHALHGQSGPFAATATPSFIATATTGTTATNVQSQSPTVVRDSAPQSVLGAPPAPTAANAAFSAIPPSSLALLPPPQTLSLAYIQNFDPRVHIYSGPCRCTADPIDFGPAGPQFTTFTVAGPQVGDRIYVYNPVTNNYGWIDSSGVGPAGPPIR